MLNWILINKIILNALEEDINYGDVTTEYIVSEDSISSGFFMAKEDGIIAGIEIAKKVFSLVDKKIKFKTDIKDGDMVKKGEIFATVEGATKNLLIGERTALNFMQRVSGIATLTNKFVKEVEGTDAIIVDTRKTIPGLRILDKYGVKCGGGRNHRINLSDAVMIKDNHIEAAGGITNAFDKIRKNIGHTVKIEVEVKNIDEVKEAVECKADIIMLDNMDINACTEAVRYINKRSIVEASGNVDEEKARQLAGAGVDVISIGALTHSVKAMDISMKIKRSEK
jgi:nicotinate-nucleotide pyrophosphorylase (carboxylating)